jgi:hypothetical protein
MCLVAVAADRETQQAAQVAQTQQAAVHLLQHLQTQQQTLAAVAAEQKVAAGQTAVQA